MRIDVEANWAVRPRSRSVRSSTRIQNFIAQLHGFAPQAAQAVAMIFVNTTRFRVSSPSLREQTVATCESVAAGDGDPGQHWLETGSAL